MQFATWLIGTIIPFLFVIGVVIFIHEMGHFLAGRWCKVGVETFSIGFGKEIFARVDRYGTRWRLAAIPLGGYVKFYGDANGASVPDMEAAKRMSQEERAKSLIFKPLWQRAFIVAAGPLANFLLAIVIFAGSVYFTGREMITPTIEAVVPGSPADKAGLRAGDTIRLVDGRKTESLSDVERFLADKWERQITITVERGGAPMTVDLRPSAYEFKNSFGTQRIGMIGIEKPLARIAQIVPGSAAETAGLRINDVIAAIDGEAVLFIEDIQRLIAGKADQSVTMIVLREGVQTPLTITPRPRQVKAADGTTRTVGVIGIVGGRDPALKWFKDYGMLPSLALGLVETWHVVEKTGTYLAGLFEGRESIEQLSGPIGIAQISGQAAQAGFGMLLMLTAIVSVSIGLMNLLPIPILDGGHLMFFLFEALRGKPLSERVQEYGFRVGLVFVAALMLFAMWNDISLRVLPAVKAWF
jgi:regulator of sigma E protease